MIHWRRILSRRSRWPSNRAWRSAGLGSAAGCLAGGLLLGLVEAFGMHFTSPSLKMLLSYGVLIAVLLARPKGLFAR